MAAAMTPDDETLNRILNLRNLQLPPRPKVDEIRWERIVDSLGDDALEVWMILDDDTGPDDLKGTRTPIQRAVHDALLAAGIDLFPYTRLATHAELAEMATDEA
ncbi:MAG: hypothetical protein KY476_05545 [Planctomycetes bacterium]|nr:hypothetical protein [Planctomycetota bacterium]